MRAVTVRDGELHVEEHPDPVPGKAELLVAVRGAGINGADMHQRKGRFVLTPQLPTEGGPPVKLAEAREMVTLVPYGCARLRVTIFPQVRTVSTFAKK